MIENTYSSKCSFPGITFLTFVLKANLRKDHNNYYFTYEYLHAYVLSFVVVLTPFSENTGGYNE